MSSHSTKEQVAKHRATVLNQHGLELPLGMPKGPCETVKEPFDLINNWAKYPPADGDGSFSVKKNSTKPPTKFCGPMKLVLCRRGGPICVKTKEANKGPGDRVPKQQSSITECPWEIWTEETTEGWVVSYPTDRAIKFALAEGKDTLWHNHDLVKTDEDRLVFPSMRSIPKQIEAFADNLHEAACLNCPKFIMHA